MMNVETIGEPLCMSIAAVERDTGIAKETLRVWERRYGFPQPIRDRAGERVYPVDQVDRLRIIRRLVSAGYRPGKIVRQPLAHLMALSAEVTAMQHPPVEPVAADGALDAIRMWVVRHRPDELRDRLRVSLSSLGFSRFIHEILVPLDRSVQQDCANGRIRPFEERLFTESVTAVLREAVERMPQRRSPPNVLLATVPLEPSVLPLLITECLLAIEGCRSISLGVQAPVWDIAMASEACECDVVLLYFSGACNPNSVAEAVRALRSRLCPGVEIWVGGRSPVLRRKPPADAVVVENYRDIGRHVTRWRATVETARLNDMTLSAITGGR